MEEWGIARSEGGEGKIERERGRGRSDEGEGGEGGGERGGGEREGGEGEGGEGERVEGGEGWPGRRPLER